MPSKYDKKQDEIDKFQEKRMDKMQMTMTVLFIFAVVAIAFIIMNSTGMFRDKNEEALDRAELVCILAGFGDGVDYYNFEKGPDQFVFNCSKTNVTIKFNREENKGMIKWE
jgi:uncharacterized protein YpmB